MSTNTNIVNVNALSSDKAAEIRRRIEEKRAQKIDTEVKVEIANEQLGEQIKDFATQIMAKCDQYIMCVEEGRLEELPMDAGLPAIYKELNKRVTWIKDNYKFIKTGEHTNFKRAGLQNPVLAEIIGE